MLVHVNREWERLFGYTQAELRALLIKDGMRALYRLGGEMLTDLMPDQGSLTHQDRSVC